MNIDDYKKFIREQYSYCGQEVGRIEFFEASEYFVFEIKKPKDSREPETYYVDWRTKNGIDCSIRIIEKEIKDNQSQEVGLFE